MLPPNNKIDVWIWGTVIVLSLLLICTIQFGVMNLSPSVLIVVFGTLLALVAVKIH